VVLLTAEDDPKDTVVPRLLAAGADWERVEIVQMVHEAGKDRMFSLVNDLDLLRERVLAVSNVKMIQIDPITAYLGVKQMDPAALASASSASITRLTNAPILVAVLQTLSRISL
jgi:AAA domain